MQFPDSFVDRAERIKTAAAACFELYRNVRYRLVARIIYGRCHYGCRDPVRQDRLILDINNQIFSHRISQDQYWSEH